MKYPTSKNSIVELAQHFNDEVAPNNNSTYWSNYLCSGTTLWMDTGDISAARSLWCNEFSALTTNNTLLNNEVQKGTYDELLPLLSKKVAPLPLDEKVKEIAFCINAIHGLRLVKNFSCQVSVELHTDIANDVNGICEWGLRLYNICPEKFIIKVPFTPSGLIGARKLNQKGVPVNLTLGFSVRQNAFAANVAKAKYSNVFLGRIGAYFKNNNLSTGLDIGEKIVLETQHCMRTMNKKNYSNTKLIAASIRSASQLLQMVGTDIFTIPTKIISEAVKNQIPPQKSLINAIPELTLSHKLTKDLNIKHLWQVADYEKETILHLGDKLPSTPTELEEYANNNGCHDIFPELTQAELKILNDDGKIPIHEKWAKRITDKEIGIDTLLNKAGLNAFINDQKELDTRIKKLV